MGTGKKSIVSGAPNPLSHIIGRLLHKSEIFGRRPYANFHCPPSCNLKYIRGLQPKQNVYEMQQTPISIPLDLLLGLEVVEKNRSLLRLLSPILDDNTRAVDNLACISLTVQNTQTSPLS